MTNPDLIEEADRAFNKVVRQMHLHGTDDERRLFEAGVAVALERAALAFEAEAETWDELGPRKDAAKRQGSRAIRKLAGQ